MSKEMRVYLLLTCSVFVLLMVACKNDTQVEAEGVEEHANQASDSQFNPHKGPVKPICSAPAPVKDIWKLEPMLIEKGLITEEMDKEQRELVIRNYINKKNSVYENCLKGK
ncbi:hypothetical protein [Kangiella sp. M94]